MVKEGLLNYQKYISSYMWRNKRKRRIKMDGNRCRLCDEDGSRYSLDVHHRPSSYAKIPHESTKDDLITLCARCHDLITSAIRDDRYGNAELPIEYFNKKVRKRKEFSHGLERSELQIDLISPTVDAQRAAFRPAEQVDKIDSEDYIQKKKDGRRP